jgi:hypothetical protein
MGASAFDLHFKSATYGRTDTDRRELADDVAVWREHGGWRALDRR